MKKNINILVAFVLMAIAFTACNQASKESQNKFVLNGTIEGMAKGKVILECPYKTDFKNQTTNIENGEFTFTGFLSEPTPLLLKINGRLIEVYSENTSMAIRLHKDSLYSAAAKIAGGQFQADANKLQKIKNEAYKKYDYHRLTKESLDRNTSKKRRAEIGQIKSKCRKDIDLSIENFIKENPASNYSAVILAKRIYKTTSYDVIEEMLKRLDPSLDSCPVVVDMHDRVATMKKNEAMVGDFITAENVSYKLDKTFTGKQHKDVVYLGMSKNNNICALKKDGTVNIISPKGQLVSSFESKIVGQPSSIAVDELGNIFVMAIQIEKKTVKHRGKSITKTIPVGVECKVFNNKGEQQNKFKLPGLITASGAKVVGENLMISDCKNQIVGIFDAKTGKMTSKIEDMRSCCGILDLSVSDKNEILVANLGAFKVEAYDFTGKKVFSTGERGKGLNDFQGCCNPVSVAYLSNGAIVTVEKTPTRVKVYGKNGAKQIMGIDDLVKGCLYIPMTVDSQDNLYLASLEKGLIKCVTAK